MFQVARSTAVSLLAALTLMAAAFLPWLRLGSTALPGVPDPAGFFVLGLGVLGVLLVAASHLSKRNLRQWLMLVGFAGVTTLAVVWLTGPATVADRARAHAEALAIVDGVAVEPVPAVGVGYGLLLGLVGAGVLAAEGLLDAFGPRHVEPS